MSKSLITIVAELQETEPMMTKGKWIAAVDIADRPNNHANTPCIISSDDSRDILADVWGSDRRGANCEGITKLRNSASEMLAALRQVHDGDALRCQQLINYLGILDKLADETGDNEDIEFLNRVLEMCRIMETQNESL
jgi:ABC-type uncharacterized transport system ATPase subunit